MALRKIESAKKLRPTPDIYFVSEIDKLTDEFRLFEAGVDAAMEDIRRLVLTKLQHERDQMIHNARLQIGQEKRRIRLGRLGTVPRDQLSFEINPKFLRFLKEYTAFLPTENVFENTEPLAMMTKQNTVIERPVRPVGTSASERPYNLYESMRVFCVVQGKDCLGCEMEQPRCVTTLVPGGSDSCAAFSHNRNRVSLIAATGQMLRTFMLCLESNNNNYDDAVFLNKIVMLAADDLARLYLVEESHPNTVFYFDTSADQPRPSIEVAVKFVEIKDNTKSGKISGISTCLNNHLLYVSTGLDIRGYSLNDGRKEVLRCLLPPSHQFATQILGVQSQAVDWRGSSTSAGKSGKFLVYSTWGGSELYRLPIFGRTGRVDSHDKDLIADQGKVPGSVQQIVHATCDLEGNLIVAEQGNHRLQVFSQSGRAICTIAPEPSQQLSTTLCTSFEPRGVAVVSSVQLDITKHRRPILVVSDAGRDCIILFSTRFH